jgi:FeS assembly SUF system protein
MFSLFNKLTGRATDEAEAEPGKPPVESTDAPGAPTSAEGAPGADTSLNVEALLAPSSAPEADAAYGPPDLERTAALQPAIVAAISTVFDPEIPVNIYELGLIYDIEADAQSRVHVRMTLTSPACPSAQQLPSEVRYKVKAVDGVADCTVDVVWEPPWTKDMMSETAKLALGMF